MIELSVERALELLREVVAEFGEDHVYDNPDYVHGDQPGCIAGHVYHRAGLELARLAEREGVVAYASSFLNVVSGDGPRILGAAQRQQDDGKTWGEALKAAERAAQESAA